MELISNSIKYAFIGENKGQINVAITNKGGYKITVSDDGIGFPKDVAPKNLNTLGMQIVFSLTDQIDGQLNLLDKEGTTFELTF